MKASISRFALPLLGTVALHAQQQSDIPLLTPGEKQIVDRQADEFNAAIAPALAGAGKSTVRVWSGRTRLAYGTVTGDGHTVLTKFSEVIRARQPLQAETGDGSVHAARIAGVYPDEDIAVLTLDGDALPPVKWSATTPAPGTFLAATQPGGQPAAFGVVSVSERSLRDRDKAFLGIIGDYTFPGPGVRVADVAENSGAAAAGLAPGDVITTLNGRDISGLLELRGALRGVAPDAEVAITFTRDEQPHDIKAVLGSRPDIPEAANQRLNAMNRMGSTPNRVHDGFPSVIQSDMRPKPDQVGGPVVDLDGRVVGITLARAGRTESYIMPSSAVEKMLSREAKAPAAVRAEAQAAALTRRIPRAHPVIPQGGSAAPPQPGIVPGDPAQLRQHLDDMQRLMQRMDEELQRIEQQQQH